MMVGQHRSPVGDAWMSFNVYYKSAPQGTLTTH